MPRRVVPICELAEPRLAGVVEQQVVGHDQVRVGRDPQRSLSIHAPWRSSSSSSVRTRGSITTPLPITHSLPGCRIPDGIRCSFHVCAVAHDRVPGVVAALEAHDGVGPLGEQVGDLALALVAPLGADDHDSGHVAPASLSVTGRIAIQCTWAPQAQALRTGNRLRRRAPARAARAAGLRRTAATGRRTSRPDARRCAR